MTSINFYSKEQMDDKLSSKANVSTTYTKTEVDTALSSKANTSSVYTKTQVDTALDAKANASTTYSKTEVDTLVGNKQDTLVSGTNIKTINNNSILGSGNIDITASLNITSGTLSLGSDASDGSIYYVKYGRICTIYFNGITISSGDFGLNIGTLIEAIRPIGYMSNVLSSEETDYVALITVSPGNLKINMDVKNAGSYYGSITYITNS